MSELKLSINGQKTLCVQLGEATGNEVVKLLNELAARVEALERGKVDIIPIVPATTRRPAAKRRAA